ncbi:MAG: hypothetical protein ALECFALPRED_002434 [Alectoria fallacina]|uniref:Uncharacterized protein n=1 Tax=Alectoria fallacina TaxID=1903189 RepID=A0A8H3EHD0_9LECA|nr:MAG: hypothetical protein ALECFALPRED_002434 [Alectoria fallacina]
MTIDQTPFMYAANFDVLSLEARDAQHLFEQLRTPDPALEHLRKKRNVGAVVRSGSSEMKRITKLVKSVGYPQAAIVNATYDFKDNFASANPYALTLFLVNWEGSEDSETIRDRVLQLCRRTFIYPHTMQASFEVSLSPLKRNLDIENTGLHTCSVHSPRLLSIMKVDRFAEVTWTVSVLWWGGFTVLKAL